MERLYHKQSSKPGKNSTFYTTHKQGNPVRLITAGSNTAIENLSRFIEMVCSPLWENFTCRIRDTGHLLKIIDDLSISNLCSMSNMMLH